MYVVDSEEIKLFSWNRLGCDAAKFCGESVQCLFSGRLQRLNFANATL